MMQESLKTVAALCSDKIKTVKGRHGSSAEALIATRTAYISEVRGQDNDPIARQGIKAVRIAIVEPISRDNLLTSRTGRARTIPAGTERHDQEPDHSQERHARASKECK